jgi:hypothetical protein
MTDKIKKPARKKMGKKEPIEISVEELKPELKKLADKTKKAKKGGLKIVPVKPPQLKGKLNSGSIFIGDASYFGDDPQKYPEGIIPNDPANPFKDWNKFSETHQEDCNLELPGSFNGDLLGRGVVIQTHMFNGSYSVEKEVDDLLEGGVP